MDDYNGPIDLIRQHRPDIPITCFHRAALDNAARWFTENFPGKTLYAVKANPAPYIVTGLFHSGIRNFDVASIPEIQLVRELCPEAGMSFMHPVKSRPAIEQAYFDYGIREFAFDSAEELEKIVSCTSGGKDLTLILRLAVPNTYSELPLAGKFGASPEKAIGLLKAARKAGQRLGVSFHVGSQTMKPQAYTTALQLVGGILQSLPRTPVDIIDVGGGFPSIYPDMIPPPLAEYKLAIERGFACLPQPQSCEFWCEPGRALVAESCSVIVKVELRKGDVLYINDGTYGSLFDAGQMGFRFPVRLIRSADDGPGAPLKPFRFYGPTCDSIDYMTGPFFLPKDVKEGDYIEIGQLGAYGNTMRTGFNGFSSTETVGVLAPPLVTMYGDPSNNALHLKKTPQLPNKRTLPHEKPEDSKAQAEKQPQGRAAEHAG
ncbi:MAG: type III PLP-dependent enzyme [Alphaproteobacteria bacterium]|nr:type III PLP-dependent enzyme [Alphaproteobacteria bacterium]